MIEYFDEIIGLCGYYMFDEVDMFSGLFENYRKEDFY